MKIFCFALGMLGMACGVCFAAPYEIMVMQVDSSATSLDRDSDLQSRLTGEVQSVLAAKTLWADSDEQYADVKFAVFSETDLLSRAGIASGKDYVSRERALAFARVFDAPSLDFLALFSVHASFRRQPLTGIVAVAGYVNFEVLSVRDGRSLGTVTMDLPSSGGSVLGCDPVRDAICRQQALGQAFEGIVSEGSRFLIRRLVRSIDVTSGGFVGAGSSGGCGDFSQFVSVRFKRLPERDVLRWEQRLNEFPCVDTVEATSASPMGGAFQVSFRGTPSRLVRSIRRLSEVYSYDIGIDFEGRVITVRGFE